MKMIVAVAVAVAIVITLAMPVWGQSTEEVRHQQIYGQLKHISTQLDSLIKLQLRDVVWDGRVDTNYIRYRDSNFIMMHYLPDNVYHPLHSSIVAVHDKFNGDDSLFEIGDDYIKIDLPDSANLTHRWRLTRDPAEKWRFVKIIIAERGFWCGKILRHGVERIELLTPSDTLYPIPEYKRRFE
ncbi:hypothetical protein C4561_01435 [candidate division WWE3 bacterium]|uniref:Uncharacterized protein n=1 Tax=candidate division WWE3 bacterium TaxID=2053526 RepID=A0A3A4ZEY9_UNCKA|nr:MAG: hypothetical protein C4561_01435 [candidate division WWE3 bacterium]